MNNYHSTGKTEEVMGGRLNLISYDDQPVNLCLVAVNGNEYPHDLNKLQTDLNHIFRQAAARVYLTKYSLKNVDWDTNSKTGLSDEQSGAISNYNDEMLAIKRAMRRNGNYDNNTYYLFLVPRSENSGMQRYMAGHKHFNPHKGIV